MTLPTPDDTSTSHDGTTQAAFFNDDALLSEDSSAREASALCNRGQNLLAASNRWSDTVGSGQRPLADIRVRDRSAGLACPSTHTTPTRGNQTPGKGDIVQRNLFSVRWDRWGSETKSIGASTILLRTAGCLAAKDADPFAKPRKQHVTVRHHQPRSSD
jgi:hypothetical protein